MNKPKMSNNFKNNMVSICSVRQMAKKLKLSPQRFYKLIEAGVFPPPVYSIRNKKPFYTFELKQRCLKIKKDGIGFNGNFIKFNEKKCKAVKKGKSSPTPVAETDNPQLNRLCADISSALRNMGTNVTAKDIKGNFNSIFPDGVKDFQVTGESIVAVFEYFNANRGGGV